MSLRRAATLLSRGLVEALSPGVATSDISRLCTGASTSGRAWVTSFARFNVSFGEGHAAQHFRGLKSKAANRSPFTATELGLYWVRVVCTIATPIAYNCLNRWSDVDQLSWLIVAGRCSCLHDWGVLCFGAFV